MSVKERIVCMQPKFCASERMKNGLSVKMWTKQASVEDWTGEEFKTIEGPSVSKFIERMRSPSQSGELLCSLLTT